MTTARRIDTADVAKLIRAQLKARFPATKFTVRSDRYSGGSSIDVGWTDGPTKRLVESAVGHFHGATFDGMQDLKEYHDSELEGQRVSFGNDFLFCNRSLSPAFVSRVSEELERTIGWPVPRTMNEAAQVRVLNDYASTFIHRFAEDRGMYDYLSERGTA